MVWKSPHFAEVPQQAAKTPSFAEAETELVAGYNVEIQLRACFVFSRCLHIYNRQVSAVEHGTKNTKDAKSAIVTADSSDTRSTAPAVLVKPRAEASLSRELRIMAVASGQIPSHVMKYAYPLAFSSLGILHHPLAHHALAAFYFEDAYRPSADPFGSAVGVRTLTALRDSHVCYSMALQYVKVGDF